MSPRKRTNPDHTTRPSTPRRARPDAFAPLLAAALARRATLLRATTDTTCRLLHGAGDGLPGLVVERFGPVLVAQLHEGHLTLSEPETRAACTWLAEHCGATAVYRKTYPRDRSGPRPDLDAQHRLAEPWLGQPAPAELPVQEAGLTYLVRPYDGYLTGLFLDHRSGRAALRAHATGRRILNGFAYTCGHGVAAAAGGAAEIVHVDVSRKSLQWGRANMAANRPSATLQRYLCDDLLTYLPRATRRGDLFDHIILDPPTFARAGKRGEVLAIPSGLGRLVALTLPVLRPGGLLQLSVNHRGTSRMALERLVRTSATALGRRARVHTAPPLPPDFPGDPDYAKLLLFHID